MSFFTDFLIATKREAKKVASTDNPVQRWPGFPYKNLNCLDLAALYGLMTGVTDSAGIVELEDEFEYLHVSYEESVELRLFPEAFTRTLTALRGDEVARLAEAWHAAEGGVSDWELTEVRELLAKLRGLAQRAVEVRKPIMLCISGF